MDSNQITNSSTAIFKAKRQDGLETASVLKMPTLGELLATKFKPRRYLMAPWLREQENVLLYADTGVGKSLFALSLALAVAGGGEFLGWAPDAKPDGSPWRVLYADGEMHAQDVQDRVRMLLEAVPDIDREKALANITLLSRQYQATGEAFPAITDEAGMRFYTDAVVKGRYDLVILDNFSTLGEVADENAASSFNAIQDFLLRLKTTGVATILVHHAGKSGDYRGSSKLAVTFEHIVKLERLTEGDDGTSKSAVGEAQFRTVWQKTRSGKKLRDVVAKLSTIEDPFISERTYTEWDYEAGDLDRLDDFRERLEAGEFAFLAEAAAVYGVSRQAVDKWKNKGIRLGLFTEEQLGRWLAKGKRLREQKKTEAPLKPVTGSDQWGPEEAANAPAGTSSAPVDATSAPVDATSAPAVELACQPEF
ncbi:MAG TPA: AAA family ATPase [Azospirillum sp.]|nr:AAA family ATPase [Azospirillum sp.]